MTNAVPSIEACWDFIPEGTTASIFRSRLVLALIASACSLWMSGNALPCTKLDALERERERESGGIEREREREQWVVGRHLMVIAKSWRWE